MNHTDAKQELLAARADALTSHTERERVRRPRVMYTNFGGINLETVNAWSVQPNGRVRVEFATRDITLEGREALTFLRMMGDARARDPEFAAFGNPASASSLA